MPVSRIIRGWSRLHFDLDRHLNPYLPASILPRFTPVVAHFLGYRNHPPSHKAKAQLGNIPMIFWAFVGIFSSLVFIGGVALNVPEFRSKGVPTIIGSFGAAAVLDFYAIESPLAQPRNAVLGQMVASVTGIIICKLFALSPHFESIRWVGGAFACALATVLMALTGTVHPPAGATALMAVADEDVSKLGWFLLCPVALGCGLMLVAALLVNNVQRRFPYYWWSPNEMGTWWDRGDSGTEEEDLRKGGGEEKRSRVHPHHPGTISVERKPSAPSTSGDSESGTDTDDGVSLEVVIRRGQVIIPEGITLRPEEILWLENISARL